MQGINQRLSKTWFFHGIFVHILRESNSNDVFLHHTIYKQLNFIAMKSLIKKNENEATAKVAQCCAKISKTVAGCHD